MLVKCKWCGFSKDVPPNLEGKTARCPICSNRFVLAPADRRTDERQPVRHIYARIEQEGKCEVCDLTLTGLSLYSYDIDADYTIGSKLTFDLISGDTVVFKDIQAEVVRVSPQLYGCRFASLTDAQQAALAQVIQEGVLAHQQPDETLEFDFSTLEEVPDTDE